MADRLQPFLPALLLALFAGYAGTFVGGTTAYGAILGHLALGLLVFGFGGRSGQGSDPLALGPAGRFLPAAWVLFAVASLLASPVPRAGYVGGIVALLLVGLVPVVARAFVLDRERAVAGVSIVVAAIAGFALISWLAGASARPSLPLGHHGLLAWWLAILLPLALLPALAGATGRPSRRSVALGVVAGLLGVTALVASRSAAGLGAVAVEAGVAALWGGGRGLLGLRGLRRGRLVVGLVALVALAAAIALVPRGVSILTGHDPSASTRWVYAQAGLAGWSARPILGWGPGSTPWTLGAFLAPVPGVNPPGEAVGELHSLPLTVAYELGAAGLLLALAVAFACGRRLWRQERGAPDPLRRAGLLGLLGGAVASLASGAWAVTALPVAGLIAVGAALAPSLSRSTDPPRRAARWLARSIALVAFLLLAPFDCAHRAYDRAIDTDRAGSIAALDAAIAADPALGLYRARRAAYKARDRKIDAEEALRAARAAGDVAPLWLLAGELGVEARRPWSGAALDRACRAAPFDGLAPWLRLRAEPPPADPTSIAARALLAEPRLLAAAGNVRRAGLLRAAVARIERLSGIDAGWREALVAAAGRQERTTGPNGFLYFGEETVEGSASVHWFRRRPWGSYLGGVAVRPGAENVFDGPAATRLSGTAPALFASPDCRLGVPP